jgi:hypothetical protein
MARLIQENNEWVIVDKWTQEDIIEQAANHDEVLSEDEVYQVMLEVVKYHDCNTGINWGVIDSCIDTVIGERV